MPVNKRSKYRGSRTCGGGTHKNRRGGGSRGGRGHAGGCKHHFVRYYMQGKTYGKNGFHNPTPSDVEAMDLGTLDLMVDSLLSQGIAKKEGKAIALDAGAIGIDKILGQGRVTRALNIQARAFSEAAKRKIEEQGGQALVA
ncbi:MAG: 50S ribosomal protein L15 [Methanomicrobiales archaeon]|nr:50S ribosomal protein L15 [Methanomicrobiales archaeon]MDD1647458.1 50S ribosomal protein L15 [Methanomicrobiales archaeon]